jgi:hypothetical protein
MVVIRNVGSRDILRRFQKEMSKDLETVKSILITQLKRTWQNCAGSRTLWGHRTNSGELE